MNTTKIIAWSRANIVTIIMLVLMVAAVITAPLMASRWNQSVRRDAESRVAKLGQISGLTRSTVSISIPGQPPRSVTTVVNPRLLQRYEEVTGSLRSDAAQVRREAVAFNRKERGVLVPRLFPSMPEVEKDTLPAQLPSVMEQAYESLLTRVRAGSPPDPAAVVDALTVREAQFIANNLRRQSRSDLDASELRDLTEELSKARLARYGEAAGEISFYAALSALPVPARPTDRLATISELFEWQWDYWVTEDILLALAEANAGSPSVATSPVKRVIVLAILDRVGAAAPADRGGGAAGGGGLGFGAIGPAGGAGGDVPLAAADEIGGAGGVPSIDAGARAGLDFRASFTGRVTTHLYDVRRVQLRIVAATERLPQIMDALARRNFITVLDVSMTPADPFVAAEDGYIYGIDPVSDVTMLLETVWLREWTAPFMPDGVRRALNVGSAPAAVDGAPPPAQPGRTDPSDDPDLDEYLRSLDET